MEVHIYVCMCVYVYIYIYGGANVTWHMTFKSGYTLVTLPRIVTPYRDSVDGTRDRVTYQKLVTR